MTNPRAKRLSLVLPLLLLLSGPWGDPVQGSSENAAPAVPARFAGRLEPCSVERVEGSALCGRYEVWEDRTSRSGRKIPLNIIVLPATTAEVEPDPLVYLAGGGVLPATEYAGYFARAYPELRRHRDILLVDQRGTGDSNPLHCDLPDALDGEEFRDETRYLAAVRRCRVELEKKADLRFYTTPHAMDDLDDVRQWLGFSRLNLYGMSYGTKAALVYVRQHPDRVRVVALHGSVPLDNSMSLDIPRSAQEALDRVFDRCAAQPACAAAFPQARQELEAVQTRLAKQPVRVNVKNREGVETEVMVDPEIVRRYLHAALYGARGIQEIPLVMHKAHEGDFEPLAQRMVGGGYGPPKGVLATILCSEEIPRVDSARIPEATAKTFIGSAALHRQIRVCQEWVRGELPEKYWAPVRSSLPVLLLTGALDHATPPRYGDRVATTLSSSRHLILPDRGHNDVDPCVSTLIQSFVIRGTLDALDTSCAGRSEGLAFKTAFEPAASAAAGAPPASALETIRPAALRAHMSFLADDLLEGRGTSGRSRHCSSAAPSIRRSDRPSTGPRRSPE